MITPRRSLSPSSTNPCSQPSQVHLAYQAMNDANFDLSFMYDLKILKKVREEFELETLCRISDNTHTEHVRTGYPEIAPMEYIKVDSVRLVLLRPKNTAHQSLPVVIYMHGGGFVFGSFKSKEKFMRDVVVKAHVALVYVDYSLSPEARYPVAIEECYSAALWAHEQADSYGYDRSKISFMGDSSGGCLAASTSILLDRRGHRGKVESLILIYPMLAHERTMYESDALYGQGDYLLTSKEMTYYSRTYMGPYHHPSPQDPILTPIYATGEDLQHQPRCLMLTAECDVLRDEGEHYVRMLTNAGVESCSIRLIGAIHGFMAMSSLNTTHYRRGLNLIAGFLEEADR